MKSATRSLLLVFLVLLSGCTSQLYMKTAQPAGFALPKEKKEILLIYFPDPSLLKKQGTDQAYFFKGREEESLYRTAAEQALASASETFRKDPATTVEILGKGVLDSMLSARKTLSREALLGLSKTFQATHVLVLQGLSAKTTVGLDFIEGGSQGGPSPFSTSTSTQAASYQLAVKAQWALYDSRGLAVDSLSLAVLKPIIINDKMSRKSWNVKPSVKESQETLTWAAKATGEALAQRYYPQQRVVNRPYYRTGALAEAAEWIKVKNWKEASALLLPLASDPSPALAGKAAYTLAVVHEAQGQVEEAKGWAAQAASKGNRHARAMLQELSRR